MNEADIKEKINLWKWKKWLQRPFGPFMISLFADGIRKEYFNKIGVPNVEFKALVFERGYWYESNEVFDNLSMQLEPYLKKHTIFEITNTLKRFYKKNKRRIKEIIKEKGDCIGQLREVYEILTTVTTFIWLTHGLEKIYTKKINEEVPKYVSENIEEFTAAASFPKKKTANILMEEAIKKGIKSEKIAKEYGWLKVRGGFSEPFSIEEIEQQKKEFLPHPLHKKIKIPKALQKLFSEVQELVYFRTARTDILHEFVFISRPLLKKVAQHYNLQFNELQYYPIQNLIGGKLEKYSLNYSFVDLGGEYLFSEELIVKEEKNEKKEGIKGTVVYKGIIKGRVKIVTRVDELDKVKPGDILVTQMTFPSYITAMKKAVAFVTDEGGITCHAAIVAREMQKPCIVGTKIATKLLKDNDLVEVDADNGIVKKIKL